MHTPFDQWEHLFIDVFNESMKSKITIGNIYRPPRSNNNNAIIHKFIDEISPLIKLLSKEKNNCFIAGDFNINLLEINQRNKYLEYLDKFTTNGFYPSIIYPTRISKKRGTLIDQIFCKYTDEHTLSRSGILHTKLSDHLPCFSAIGMPKLKKSVPRFIKMQNKDEKSIQEFILELDQSLQNQTFIRDLTADPNENYNCIHTAIKSSYDKHLAPKTVKSKRYKHKLSPWITTEILRQIQCKDKLYKELHSTARNSPEFDRKR